MRRAALCFVALAGCLIESADDRHEVQQPQLSTAERAWLDDALPALEAQCVVCHSGTAGSPSFLAGETPWQIRDSLLASGVVDVAAPETSRLLTKGVHYGPAMNAVDTAALLHWLQAERDEHP
jgi:hypothetical protein